MIDNEQDIMLFFNSHENTLSAYSKKPLLIENEFLGYTLEFEMEEFVNYFRKKSLERLDNIRFTVIAGFTRFTDNIIYDEKISKRRTKAYLGSSMHFIRSCWNNNLTDQNYGLKKNYKSVEPEDLLEIIDEDNDTFKTILFLDDMFVVHYKSKTYARSTVRVREGNSISVDKYGSYAPYRI